MAGVLEGLTVLDLSTGVAGPMTAMLLADAGARVIKVEPPGGDPTRTLSGARVWHRGKESVVLDLEEGEDRATFWRMVSAADVLVETYEEQEGVRLGVRRAALAPLNERLVHCSITGYGGLPRHRGHPPLDALVAARTGLHWEKRGWPGGSIERLNGVTPFLPDLEVDPELAEGPARPGPLFSAIPWPSISACHLAVIGISAALYVRERTGRGQHVETSLLQGALVNGAFTWQRVGRPQRPGWRMWVTDPRAPNGFFRTADDQWVQQWTPQPGFVLGAAAGDRLALTAEVKPVRDDPDRVGMDPEDLLVLLELHRPMAEAFARFPAAEWEEVAAQANVSVQRIRSPEEAFCDPLFLDDGCVVEVEDPEVGRIRQVGLTYHLHAVPGAVTGPAPIPDQHGEAIRHQFGASRRADPAGTLARTLAPAHVPAEAPAPAHVPGEAPAPAHVPGEAPAPADAPSLSRGPLEGVVVLDLGMAIAGPFGTQMLGDLGAEVIKVNTPTDRAWTEYHMGMCCNRGKRSIMIDLKKQAGLDVLTTMVRRADVVHTNMHWDSVVKLGVDDETLRRINPRLIYCHTRGFENGPRMLLVGHDQSGAALAGVTWEEGGLANGGKPIWPNTSLGDTGNGLLSATAVIQALYHRDRTGQGQFVDTSIVYAHLLNASMAWLGLEGADCPRPTLDAEQYGLDALHRLYETARGWLCLALSSEDQWPALARCLGLGQLTEDPRFATPEGRASHDAELAGLLASLFAGRPAAEWAEKLRAEGVPAEVSSETFATELFDDPDMIARGLVVTHEHPLMGTVEMFGRTIDFSATPGSISRGPIVAGQHTREILAEHGYDPAAIGRLLADRIVFEAEDLT